MYYGHIRFRDYIIHLCIYLCDKCFFYALITDQDVLLELERENILKFTPSRRVKGKRVVCYDDRYILNLASETGGIVVSNDNYRDLLNESEEYKHVIEERLLMYTFVNDR